MFIVRTSLRHSSIHGIGVFLKEPVCKGQVVWQYDPRVDVAIPASEFDNFPPAAQDYLKIYTYVAVMDERRMMILCADNSRHVNHAGAPNLVDTPDGLQEIAARDIPAGKELTCDYFASDLEAAAKLGRENV